MAKPNLFEMSFSRIYPMYVTKVEKKNRTKEELDEAIYWLTGYDEVLLKKQLDDHVSLTAFFDEAPHFNEKAKLITGVICGYRVEEIDDQLLQKIRYLDKLVDEIAKGKAMEKVLRK